MPKTSTWWLWLIWINKAIVMRIEHERKAPAPSGRYQTREEDRNDDDNEHRCIRPQPGTSRRSDGPDRHRLHGLGGALVSRCVYLCRYRRGSSRVRGADQRGFTDSR